MSIAKNATWKILLPLTACCKICNKQDVTLLQYFQHGGGNVADVAKRMKKDRSTIWRWAHGKSEMSGEDLVKIEKATRGKVTALDCLMEMVARNVKRKAA